jgi:hypothetical protein
MLPSLESVSTLLDADFAFKMVWQRYNKFSETRSEVSEADLVNAHLETISITAVEGMQRTAHA